MQVTHKKNITILNVYVPESLKINEAKMINLKEEINKPLFIVKNSRPPSQQLIELDRKSANVITTKEFEFVITGS